jgi:hypothetical protein
MDNDQVIASLEQLISDLRTRLSEVEALRSDRTVPLEERFDREMRINARLSSLNQQIAHASFQLNNRQLARQLQNAVFPLDPAEITALTAALQKVSTSISAAATFSDKIQLAAEISAAASSGVEAAAV